MTFVYDIHNQLRDLDSKTGKDMVEDDKHSLCYQLECYKDDIEELNENHIRLQKDYKVKCRLYDNLNRDFSKLKEECEHMRECLRMRNAMLEEAGILCVDNESNASNHSNCNHMNGHISDKRSESLCDESGSESGTSFGAPNNKIYNNTSIITQEASQILAEIEGNSLTEKLRTLIMEKKLLLNEISQLKSDLNLERSRRFEQLSRNSGSNESLDSEEKSALREANKLVGEYKTKLRKSEQEISKLEGCVTRFEAQIATYRRSSEDSEKLEDELKADKRKLQRNLREAQSRIEELELSNSYLQKRIDTLKNRNLIPKQ